MQSRHLRAFLADNSIHATLAVTGVVVLLLAVVLGQQTWRAYLTLGDFQQDSATLSAVLTASDAQARERGLTAARLSATSGEGIVPRELDDIRAEVDAAWREVRERLTNRIQDGPVARRLHALEQALKALRALRGRIDAGFTEEAHAPPLEDWIEAASTVNTQAAMLRRELLLAAELPREVARQHWLINSQAAELAEHAGQFRGALAYYIAARAPLPASQAESARLLYGLTRERLSRLLAVGAETAPAGSRVATLLEEVRARRGDFEKTGAAVLAGAETGAYPLHFGAWWLPTSAFIERLFALTRAVDARTADRLREEARARLLWLGGYGALAMVALVLALASLARVRHYADQVFVEKEMTEIILSSIGDAVVATEADGRIRYLNPIAAELVGCSPQEAHGRPYREVFQVYNRLHSSEIDPIGTCLKEDRIIVLTEGHVLITHGGRETPIDDSCAPIRDRDGRVLGAVVVFTSKARLQSGHGLLSYHASHDALTGLCNRRAFEHALYELLERTQHEGGEHALAFLDLDNFKVINDTAGHAAGDQMLRRIGSLMKRQVRDSDLLGRLGGDEFALLLRHCNLRQAEEVALKLREEVRALRFPWAGQSFQSGLSIGLVAIDADSPSVEVLLRDADAACYAAKELGRNHIHIYRPSDEKLVERQGYTAWAARITEALDEERFTLYCQAIRPLRQGLALHSELLLRLRERDGSLVSPGAFIPAAERHGLMPDIDQWVIETGCRLTAPGLAAERTHILTINLSGTTLSDAESAERIAEAVRRHGVDPAQITFEVTETAAMSSLDTALLIMERLRGEGFRFALDDFGSGLSSLNYLKELPVDLVKIDGRFIRQLPEDPVATAMVGAIVNIAGVMGINTCAEFVENAAIQAAVERLGVDYGQGYHFARPRPLSECLDEHANPPASRT